MSARRAGTALVAAVAALALSACGGPPSHDDPRDGRHTLTWTNCAWSTCIYDWEICVGRDLHVHIEDAEPEDTVIKNAPECAP